MQTVKWENKDITLIGKGSTVLIYSEEFHEDIFASMNLFITGAAKGKIDIYTISKLFYALAKTANRDVFSSYKTFMENTIKVGQFATPELISAIVLEIESMMDTGKKEESEDTKKKGTRVKKEQ